MYRFSVTARCFVLASSDLVLLIDKQRSSRWGFVEQATYLHKASTFFVSSW